MAHPINEVFTIHHDQLLGKGSTGNVYAGWFSARPQHRVAIKEIDLNTIDNQVTQYLLSCEIAALSNLGKVENSGHENIVRLMEVVMQNRMMYLVMQLLEGGTLAERIKQNPQGLPQEVALSVFSQILEGYKKVKQRRIIHRDLKPDNILFRQQDGCSIAIIDFGYCTMQEVPNKPQCYYNVGSPKYMAPQAYKNNHYSQKSDIWAIGVMLYQMLMGFTCDKGLSMDNYLELLQRKGIPLPNKLNQFHKRILSDMLQFNHQQRKGCDQLLHLLRGYLQARQGQRKVEILEIRPIEATPQKGNHIMQEINPTQSLPHLKIKKMESSPPPSYQRTPLCTFDSSNIKTPQRQEIQPLQMRTAPGSQLNRQNSQNQLRSTMTQGDIVSIRPNRNQLLFHSLMFPQQSPMIKLSRNSVQERQLRSQSKIQLNQNMGIDPTNARVLSFHFQNDRIREEQAILGKVENVNLDSVRQIVHRKDAKNNEVPQMIKQSTMMPIAAQELRQQIINSHSQYIDGQKTINQGPPQFQPHQVRSAHLIINNSNQIQSHFNNVTPKGQIPGLLQMSLHRPLQPINEQQRPNFNNSPRKEPILLNIPPQDMRRQPEPMRRIIQERTNIIDDNEIRNERRPKLNFPQPIIKVVSQDLSATRVPVQEHRPYERAINPHSRNLFESVHPTSPHMINLQMRVPNQQIPHTTRQEVRIMPQHISPQMRQLVIQ